MKRVLKGKTFILILSIVILLGFGTALAYTYLAQDVGFTPKDSEWNSSNTKVAIDDLKTRLDDYCFESPYEFDITYKLSSSSFMIYINDTNSNFIRFFCGVDGNYDVTTTDGTCKITGIEPNTNYTITIGGIDRNIKVKKLEVPVTSPSNLLMDTTYLNSGNKQGNVTVYTSTPDGTAGLSITGTSDLRDFSAPRATFIAHYRKWYKDVDLSNYNELTFYARKGANHGNIMVDIDDTEVVQKAYGSLDTNWALYTVDLTNYTGIHTLTIAGGYSDYSGSSSSNTQYYHIELR